MTTELKEAIEKILIVEHDTRLNYLIQIRNNTWGDIEHARSEYQRRYHRENARFDEVWGVVQHYFMHIEELEQNI